MASFPVDWLFIVIIVSLVLNLVFVLSAIAYTVLRKPDEVIPPARVSVAPTILSRQDRRHSSLSPQVMLYHNLVRLSISNSETKQKKTFWQRFRCGSGQNVNVSMDQKGRY